MTLEEIGYMVLEEVRRNNITDDENIDIRLVYDWVNMKRSQFIRNKFSTNPNNRIDLNLYQLQPVTVAVNTVTANGDYPYSNNTTQLYKIVESTTTIPTIVEGKQGPISFTVESEDLMKLPFSIVDYDQLRFSGNGRFNTNLIFGAFRDEKLYFKYNTYFDTYTTINIRAIFEDPRLVTGFDETLTRYPANLGLIEYIKNAIFDKDIRMIFSSKSDNINDATSEV